MNYVEILPISEYEDALQDRLTQNELSAGILYNTVFTLRENKEKAIRFNVLLSRLVSKDRLVELSPVDADLRPLGWMIHTDMVDGIMKVSESRAAGLSYIDRKTGKPGTAMLQNGLLRGYQDPFDYGPLLNIASREDTLAVGC